jgi:hypothetical protein
MTLQVVKLFLPDGHEYWCQRAEMERVLTAFGEAHPEWAGTTFTITAVEMEEEEYYRRPATNSDTNDAPCKT